MTLPTNGASHEDPAKGGDGGDDGVQRLRGAEDLLGLIPYVVGFHPSDCLVLACMNQHSRYTVTLRLGLPGPDDDPAVLAAAADEVAAILTREKQVAVYLVAYTPHAEVPLPLVRELLRSFDAAGLAVRDAVRADAGRYWQLLCSDPECDPRQCPDEGMPFDPASSRIAVEEVVSGEVAFASEEELRQSIAPQTGLARAVMEGATREAVTALADSYLATDDPARAFRVDGAAYLTALISRHLTRGGRPANGEAARASVFLADVEIRDHVWLGMRRESAAQHVEFWRDLTRRAVHPYDAAPTALLAFSAWLAGKGALARMAVSQLKANHPHYGLGNLIGDLLRSAASPSLWKPEELASDAARAELGLFTDEPSPAPPPDRPMSAPDAVASSDQEGDQLR